MSVTVNSAFEANNLDSIEAVHLRDEPIIKNKGTLQKCNYLRAAYKNLDNYVSKHRRIFKFLFLTLLNSIILIYFVFATVYWRNNNYEDKFDWCNGYGLLILILAIAYGGILYHFASKYFLQKVFSHCFLPCNKVLKSIQRTRYGSIVGQTVIYTCVFIAIIAFLIVDTLDSKDRLMSGIGVILLLSFGWVFSKHPDHINWRPVLTGLILQFLFGLLAIRWSVGRAIFQCLANKVETFMNYSKSGASFIYSDKLVADGVFAFTVLPVIFYFSFFIQILYYIGVMQWIVLNFGRILQKIMGTSICESVTCATNIFVGMTESPLVIKPYLNKLTTSELHTIMCSGFATVSGTVLAAYINFGANPAHLITASLMAAPAALCYSKLFYPEVERSMVTSENIKLEKSTDFNVLDAASKGAIAAIPLVLGIVANIVAFVSFTKFINAILSWIGLLVGYKELSFELILSKVFMPLSWIMGVPWDKCEDVATLIGLKTVINEFVAYEMLGKYKEQRRIFGRTEAIATFAICGFANPASVGITLSVLTSLAPDRKENISKAIMRAFISGNIVCFLTGSIAGMLVSDDYEQSIQALTLNATTD